MTAPLPPWLHPVDLGVDGVVAFHTSTGGEAFSICPYVGDSPARVAECRRRLAEALGIGGRALIVPWQTHSARAVTVRSLPVDDGELQGVDAVVTSLPGVCVGVNTADCVPLLLVDPVARVAGAAHAGWRGAAGGVVQATVEAMIRAGASPERLRCFTGPAIGECCFEVGEEVAERFPSAVVRRLPGRKPHVDLPGAVALMLADCGVPPAAVTRSAVCTRCNAGEYPSARAAGLRSPRMFTGIFLVP